MTLTRKTPLRPRGGSELRKTALKKRNPKRAKRLFAEDFGSVEYVKWLHQFPCAICEVYGWSVAAHVRSRGAGGKADDLVPLCGTRLGTPGCHQLFDAYDPEARSHEPRLRSLAKRLRREFTENQTEEME